MSFLEDFVSLIFPNYCLTCKEALVKGEKLLCTGCVFELPKTNLHLKKQNKLTKRFLSTLNAEYAFAYLQYSKAGKVQKLLHSLKYENYPELGTLIGRWYGAELKEAGLADNFDLVIPVPLHKARKKRRGYNQSDYFAEGLSESMGIACRTDLLKRADRSESQTRKTRMERWQNVESIFAIASNQEHDIENKRILLVDDVITTGATLEACAKPILEAGCSRISIAAIATAQ